MYQNIKKKDKEIYNLIRKKHFERVIEKHKKDDDLIEHKYNFEKVWANNCSSYEESQPFILPPVKRIIVIGDLHGDLDVTLRTLKIAKLIDNNNNWIGGDTVVVQVGDQIDRCRNIPCDNPYATQNDENSDVIILELFTKLHLQAKIQGGAVYSLLGNHELMNVEKDLSYVSYKGLQEFNNTNINNEIITDGKKARSILFSPGNKYANFLACTRQVILIIGNNIFVHGGIIPYLVKKYSIKSINKIMTLFLLKIINKDDKIYKEIFDSGNHSPLWNRFQSMMVINKDNKLCDNMLSPLKFLYKVDNIYVGHTPNLNNGITSICNSNKKIWLTDYGASKSFDPFRQNLTHKKLQVLEILNENNENIYNILYES